MSLAETLNPPVPPAAAARPEPRSPARFRRAARRFLLQAVVLFVIAALLIYLGHNVALNLQARGLASGFDFLWKEAGFAIGFSLIPFTEADTYGRAFVVGLLNTAFVAVVSMTLATLLGLVIGVARVSRHPPTATASLLYVESFRNIPLLLQVLFWHQLLVNTLPAVRQSLNLGGWVFLNNRGLVLPSVDAGQFPPALLFLALLATAIAFLALALSRGEPTHTRTLTIRALLALLGAELVLTIVGLEWHRPTLAGFNFEGGVMLVPEFVGLVAALTIYNAAFIAEIVRAGIQSVSKGQREAAASLGLPPGLTMRLVILPQAMRVVIPPLANQYSHMLKASSLATVIGYPDLVNVFLGTTLNQTGRAIEVVAMTMAVFLFLTALVAAFTAWFNRYFSLVER